MKSFANTSILALEGEAKFIGYEADARLAGAVEGYWTCFVESPPVRLRVIPDGRIDLIFDLTSRVGFVAGPNPLPFDVEHLRAVQLLGATLSPEAAAAFLGAEIGSTGTGWRPLESSLGSLAVELSHRLRAARGAEAKIAALETTLLARIGGADRRVSRALAEIKQSGGRIGVTALGRSSGASPRNLARLFDQWVGMSPKTFARIARVQEALRRMTEAPTPGLKDLAAELGFSDQAHMSREVKRITGIQPSELADLFKRQSQIFKT
jgi:AraC-like DNA-binding protein